MTDTWKMGSWAWPLVKQLYCRLLTLCCITIFLPSASARNCVWLEIDLLALTLKTEFKRSWGISLKGVVLIRRSYTLLNWIKLERVWLWRELWHCFLISFMELNTRSTATLLKGRLCMKPIKRVRLGNHWALLTWFFQVKLRQRNRKMDQKYQNAFGFVG